MHRRNRTEVCWCDRDTIPLAFQLFDIEFHRHFSRSIHVCIRFSIVCVTLRVSFISSIVARTYNLALISCWFEFSDYINHYYIILFFFSPIRFVFDFFQHQPASWMGYNYFPLNNQSLFFLFVSLIQVKLEKETVIMSLTTLPTTTQKVETKVNEFVSIFFVWLSISFNEIFYAHTHTHYKMTTGSRCHFYLTILHRNTEPGIKNVIGFQLLVHFWCSETIPFYVAICSGRTFIIFRCFESYDLCHRIGIVKRLDTV